MRYWAPYIENCVLYVVTGFLCWKLGWGWVFLLLLANSNHGEQK